MTFDRKLYCFHMKLQMNQLLMRKIILKLLFFLVVDDALTGCINWRFEFYTNHEATFGFLYNLHKLQEMSEKALKCQCINLHLKLNFDLHKTDLYEEQNIF